MIHPQKCIVIDIDGTLCPIKEPGERYEDLVPYPEMIEVLERYQAEGFYIILATSRNMRTYDGNLGLIMANTAPVMLEWLKRHGIPFDEIHFGKPWSGNGGFYVDDKTIRPSEFRRLNYEEIQVLLANEQPAPVA
jgi:capsule biosynthesis phosphatase